jgi:probable rRNA maturation factor
MATIRIQNRRGKTVPTARLRKIAQTISDASGCPDAELSVVLTEDAGIRALNRTWRGIDRPTDVLSFPQREGEGPAGTPGAPLGDVVISLETAAVQAEKLGHSLEAEVRRLLVHGVLHLLGHDHVQGGRAAAAMRRQERRLLARLDEALPLAVEPKAQKASGSPRTRVRSTSMASRRRRYSVSSMRPLL